MNITVSKIKRILEKDYGWANLNETSHKTMIDELIKDTLKIINKQLKLHKGISIKK